MRLKCRNLDLIAHFCLFEGPDNYRRFGEIKVRSCSTRLFFRRYLSMHYRLCSDRSANQSSCLSRFLGGVFLHSCCLAALHERLAQTPYAIRSRKPHNTFAAIDGGGSAGTHVRIMQLVYFQSCSCGWLHKFRGIVFYKLFFSIAYGGGGGSRTRHQC
jgi:hypothetical protein